MVTKSERAVGVNPAHVIHQTISKEGGSFTIAEKNEFIAQTFGHILAIPYVHLPLWTPHAIVRNTPPETIEYLKERWKDVPWKGDVLVRIGHTSLFGDIQRSMADKKDLSHMPPKWMRTLVLPYTLLQSFLGKFMRLDHYNAFTNTAHVFHADKAMGMGRIAQAHWFDQMDSGLLKGVTRFAQALVPLVTSVVEWKTFEHAMPRFTSDADRRSASKIFEPYWGKETMLSVAPWVGTFIPSVPGGLFGFTEAAYFGGLAGGHFMARVYPKQEERFGWVFEGMRPEFSPRAMPPKKR